MIEKGYHYLTCFSPQDLPTPVIALVVALACSLPFLPGLRSSSSTTTSKPVEKTAEKTEKTEWTSFKWPPSQSPQQIPENTVNICLPFIVCPCLWWLLPGDQLSLLFLFQPTTILLFPLMTPARPSFSFTSALLRAVFANQCTRWWFEHLFEMQPVIQRL